MKSYFSSKKNLFISAFLAAFVTLSCGEQNNHQHSEEEQSIAKEKLELSLNNGRKWEANPETTEGVQSMIQLVETFDNQNSSTTALKSDLESEFTMIFKKCTMEGKAHNQLHNFLLPLRKMFKELESSDIAIQNKTMKRIHEQLTLYQDYFE